MLAALRVGVFAGIVIFGLRHDPRPYASLPAGLELPPDVGGIVLEVLPRSPWLVTAAWALMLVSAGAAAVGWRARFMGLTAVTTGAYCLGVGAMFGKVDHNHHLLWIGLVVALSPCADRFAPGARGGPHSAVYGFPLRVTWLLIGLIYLGAGLPKWRSAGVAWALSDNLRNHMWATWVIDGYAPPLRFDLWPWLYQPAALATLIVEVGFVLAVLHRRTRLVAVAAGLTFHLGTQVALGFTFLTLLPCYVAFWPSRSEEGDGREPSVPAVVSGVGLLAAVAACAIVTVPDGWPVASYPAFYPVGEEVALYVVSDQHGEVTADDVGLRPDAWHYLRQRVGQVPDLFPILAEHLNLDGAELTEQIVHTDPDDVRVVEETQLA